MTKSIHWFCFGVLCCLIFLLMINQCDRKPEYLPKTNVDYIKSKVKAKNKEVDTIKAEVIKWKEAKTKIIYRTKFDTLATIDTVFVELIKCDSANQVSNKIIAKQDTIIQKQDTIIKGHEEIIYDQDLENQYLAKEIKKQKHKTFLTKVVAVGLIVLSILIIR